jgi:KUP system potassium uptake protein
MKPGEPTSQGGSHGKLAPLALTALGVVYGDLGTSPLYTLKECFSPKHGVPLNPDNVLGILSLITWSLLLIVTLKYLRFILRASSASTACSAGSSTRMR